MPSPKSYDSHRSGSLDLFYSVKFPRDFLSEEIVGPESRLGSYDRKGQTVVFLGISSFFFHTSKTFWAVLSERSNTVTINH